MRKIIIYGAGGHAKVVADIIKNEKKFKVYGFIDDNKNLVGQKILEYPILGTRELLPHLYNQGIKYATVAIGNNKTRVELVQMLKKIGFNLPHLIHPKAVVAQDVVIGEGTVVMAGAVINPGTKIGNYVIINTGANIDHDNIICDGVHIAPGAHLGGGVKVEKMAWIGIGASIREYRKIGNHSLVGMGAVVVKDVPDNITVVGVPAKPFKK